MEDASKLPVITDALLKKGYPETAVAKILGGNLLRVMEQVERAAATRVAPATVLGQVATHPLDLRFTPSADTFRAATQEYRDIWSREGGRIVAAMERRTGLRFESGPIDVSIYEGTSFSGEPGGRPMLLRASYPETTKRGTLVHELGHRLASEIVVPFDHHEVIDLFVYDVWIDLWGQSFADEQIAIESTRNGADYAGMWKNALAMSPEERARRLQEIIKQYRKPRG
jgi:hypothetical protein